LLQDCLDRAQAAGLERAWLEVRTGNAAAIALYRRFGFVEAGCRKKYYADGADALVMERSAAVPRSSAAEKEIRAE
jgi:ribosomal-protein-alanine N-acetyltransferase